jgi:ATP phosphoribosyltransferase
LKKWDWTASLSEIPDAALFIKYRITLQVVMAKAPDVITYVEHGVCEIGIVGKDTILEQGNSFYEVLDLGSEPAVSLWP